ncbi:predicted protein [Naegleria gruberi]|uniref:Predicted protein n=1 Tax=Naegleria gruberi TaxID=5762 RepID=D2VJ42_NAEGR|nr:uncharacterized protein NAEGRDRAFT_68900 [Naegleria gruberi]EFC43133.1 predicted protein [Naegleria gruberi]|eukprot:XP_002675877.1 predicted protein [Naegleria gruberi strain NEG-M]
MVQLFSVNASDASFNPVGPPNQAAGQSIMAQQLSDIDEVNKIFYVLSLNSTNNRVYLLGMSLKSGEIVRNILLPIVETYWVGFGQSLVVNQNNGDVYVVGQESMNAKFVLLSINYETSQITKLNEMQELIAIGSICGFDPKNNILWLEFAKNRSGVAEYDLYAFEPKSGKLITTIVNTELMQTMEFDRKTGVMIGIGLKQLSKTAFQRTIVTLDGSTFKMKTILNVQGNYVELNDIMGPIDYVNRILYCLMRPAAAKVFDFLMIDLDSGAILNKVNMLGKRTPWNLQFLNNL